MEINTKTCARCSHYTICKYIHEKEQAEKELQRIIKQFNARNPCDLFRISLNCKSYADSVSVTRHSPFLNDHPMVVSL